MNGDAASITNGNITASATIRTAAVRVTLISGDDSKTTGNSVQADMVQSAVNSILIASATAIGAASVAQNATATNRRPVSLGQCMSAIAARLGRVATTATMSGNATYAAAPATKFNMPCIV